MRSQYETIDLHAPVSAHEWMRDAACLGFPPDTFFPEKPDSSYNNEWLAARVEEAKAICAGCPVRRKCLELGKDEKDGVWGGIHRSPGARKNQHAQKTHCIRGHEFTPENTRQRPTGTRGCRECERAAARARWEERKREKEQAA